MDKIIGYYLAIRDNDSYAFRDRPVIKDEAEWYEVHQSLVPNMSGQSHPGLRRCRTCGELLAKWQEILTGLKVKKRRLDISCTYDGVVVVSKAFQKQYQAKDLSGLTFSPLPDDPAFQSVQATNRIPYDPAKRGSRFVKQCQTCGKFESVVGATPVCLREGAAVPALAFVQTDLEFGSGDGKHPLLLCGTTAGEILEKSMLKGIDLVPF